MRRRELLTVLGGAMAWPLAAQAQQHDPMKRIGMLMGSTERDGLAAAGMAAFTKALAELGWTEGRNIHIDVRCGASDVGRVQASAKELLGLKPDLLVGYTTPATAALQRETSTIPIVFLVVSDPVGSGFVASLPHPGANITGFSTEDSIGGKWIEILKDIVPGISGAALLYNPDTAPYYDYYRQPFEAAARSSGIEAMSNPVRTAEDIERVVTSLAHRGGAGLAVMPDIFLVEKRNLDLIIALAARHRVPTVYPYGFFVAAGGLISYGNDNADLWRRSATYVDRILKGATPADLPVQQPTKFELAVNLKTAMALGLTIPAILQATADEVIE
jgi:putative ABC transport system substrate-binding protein